MLGDIGSIASILGVAVSLVGLGFAIWQLLRLRGETRAARVAAETTRTAVRRDLVIADVNRMWGRIQVLKGLHRENEWVRALDIYPEIQRGLTDIRSIYPILSEEDAENVRMGLSWLQNMEYIAERGNQHNPQESVGQFNQQLSEIQLWLTELENKLWQSS